MVNSDAISWDGTKGATEASDLGWRAGDWPRKFQVRSGKTGQVMQFDRKGAVRDDEGDLMYVQYRSHEDRGRLFIVTVYND